MSYYTQLHFEIPDSVMNELEGKLEGVKKPEAVIKSASNYTARRLQKELARKVQAVYRYQGGSSAVMAASKILQATVKNASARIDYAGRTHGIEEFHVSGSLRKRAVRGAVYGAVEKRSSPKILRKETGLAFMVRYSNGHIGVAYRATQAQQIASQKNGRPKLPRYQKKYNQHSAILKSIQSPAIPSMVKSDNVYGALEGKYQEIFMAQIKKVMEKAIYGQ